MQVTGCIMNEFKPVRRAPRGPRRTHDGLICSGAASDRRRGGTNDLVDSFY